MEINEPDSEMIPPEDGYSHGMDWDDYGTNINRNTRSRMKDCKPGREIPLDEGLTHRQRIK